MWEHGIEDDFIWIGAFKGSMGWDFTNYEIWDYKDWGQDQPSGDGDCGCLTRGYFWQWNDLPCSTEHYFICEV